MLVKHRIRALLGNAFKDTILKNKTKAERVTNLFDTKLGTLNEAEEQFGLIRVLAVDSSDAKSIIERLSSHKDELRMVSAREVGSTFDYLPERGTIPEFSCSILVKVEPKPLIESALKSMTDDGIEQIKTNVTERCKSQSRTSRRVLIDYSSPNIAKPFHFGHLKSTVLGNFLANLNRFLGSEVIRLNYIGDWGMQYGLLGLGLDKFERLTTETDASRLTPVSDSDLNDTSNAEKTLRKLLRVYAAANELGRKDVTFFREAGKVFESIGSDINSNQYKRWMKIRALSLEELKCAYKRLNIEFDEFEYESQYAKSTDFIEELSKRGHLTKHEDGFTSAKVSLYSKLYDAPLLKSDGSSLYLSRDIAAALHREQKYNFDEMLYVAGTEQEKHFESLRAITRLLGHNRLSNSCVHVKTGRVIGLSSRKSGDCTLLSDIIRDAKEKYIETTRQLATSKVAKSESHELLERVGHTLALSALFVFDMKLPRKLNYNFSWEEVLATKSSSGINLQATYARLCSLREKACHAFNLKVDEIDKLLERADDLDVDAINCVEGMNVVSVMSNLDDALFQSQIIREPRPVLLHAFRLCNTVNRARRSKRLNVINEQNESYALTRLALFMGARRQLETIIRLVGLEPLEKV